MWQILLTFKGGMTVALNDVRSVNPGWAECNSPGIVKLEFSFTGKMEGRPEETPYSLIMTGMDEYNFFVEASKGIGNSKINVKGLWFMGKLPNQPYVTGFVLGDSIKTLNAPKGKEYYGAPTAGWKKGIIEGKVVSSITRNV